MTPERLKDIKERHAPIHGIVRELVAEIERLQHQKEALLTAIADNHSGVEKERDSLAARLAVAREALGDIRAYTCANRLERADTCIEAGYTPCEVCIATEALARIDGDGAEGFPPKQEDCPAEFLAVANTLEPLTSEGAGTEGKGG